MFTKTSASCRMKIFPNKYVRALPQNGKTILWLFSFVFFYFVLNMHNILKLARTQRRAFCPLAVIPKRMMVLKFEV